MAQSETMKMEGTPEELASLLGQLSREKRYRLVEVEDAEPPPAPNEAVLAMLREIAVMKAGMKPTNGEETDRLLREARAGAMYGDGSNP